MIFSSCGVFATSERQPTNTVISGIESLSLRHLLRLTVWNYGSSLQRKSGDVELSILQTTKDELSELEDSSP